MTNANGNVMERYSYSAYGNLGIYDPGGVTRTTSNLGNRYTYTGREYDEALGLYHYRARMYNAVAGRFVSRDPIGYEGSRWNLTAFSASRPLISIDPFGLHDGLIVIPDHYFYGVSNEGNAYIFIPCNYGGEPSSIGIPVGHSNSGPYLYPPYDVLNPPGNHSSGSAPPVGNGGGYATSGTGYPFPIPTDNGPKVGNDCAKKFAWMAPDTQVEDLGNKLESFSECMSKIKAKPGSQKWKDGVAKCVNKTVSGDLSDEVIEMLAHVGCCEHFKDQHYPTGDPCNRGTSAGDPPGTNPEQFPCWKRGPKNVPPPKDCFQCCDFLGCTKALSASLSGNPKILIKSIGFIEKCKGECINTR